MIAPLLATRNTRYTPYHGSIQVSLRLPDFRALPLFQRLLARAAAAVRNGRTRRIRAIVEQLRDPGLVRYLDADAAPAARQSGGAPARTRRVDRPRPVRDRGPRHH